MHNAFGVRGFEAVGDLNGQIQQFVGSKRLVRNPALERLPFEQFHGDEGPARVLTDVVDGADVRMIQRRSRSRLAQEAVQSYAVLREFFGKEFEGDGAAQARVFRLENYPHSPATQFLRDAVMRYRSPNHENGICPETSILCRMPIQVNVSLWTQRDGGAAE